MVDRMAFVSCGFAALRMKEVGRICRQPIPTAIFGACRQCPVTGCVGRVLAVQHTMGAPCMFKRQPACESVLQMKMNFFSKLPLQLVSGC